MERGPDAALHGDRVRASDCLEVAPGMTVVVRHDDLTAEKVDKDWWMGQVIHGGGAARDPLGQCRSGDAHPSFGVRDL